MKNISVYTQKDLDEIERDFSGCINIYGAYGKIVAKKRKKGGEENE